MYYYELGWAKERMEDAIKAREQSRLGRELRLAVRGPRKSLLVRTTAFVTALLRG